MNELEVYKKAFGDVINQNAQLTADLALAHAQIDVLTGQLKQLENSDKEKGSE